MLPWIAWRHVCRYYEHNRRVVYHRREYIYTSISRSTLSPRILDLRAEVAPVAVLHDNAKMVLARCKERVLVAHNIRVVQPPHQLYLE